MSCSFLYFGDRHRRLQIIFEDAVLMSSIDLEEPSSEARFLPCAEPISKSQDGNANFKSASVQFLMPGTGDTAFKTPLMAVAVMSMASPKASGQDAS